MTKKEFTLNQLEEFVGDCAHDVIAHEFDERVSDHQFKTIHQYEDYGDTSIEVAQYIGDDEEIEVREDIEKDLDIDTVIEMLRNDAHFRESIQDLIEKVVWERPLNI